MHGLSIPAKADPGVLFDMRYDDKGDLDRESFFVKAVSGRAGDRDARAGAMGYRFCQGLSDTCPQVDVHRRLVACSGRCPTTLGNLARSILANPMPRAS
ncbi:MULTISPECIES: hypothetical protein [Piscinibacter]|uniref:hypothetical protein n=1 Tax=Piscinibacter TaxID=1114981 RepID=UPI001F0C82EC|nr:MULTISPECIES: hypothetical protein [Piscinibacter]